jgi:hypothetical protein
MGPTSAYLTDILIDTGSDDIVLPTRLASHLGVPLGGGPQGTAAGIGSTHPVSLQYVPLILELRNQSEVHRWRAVVAFTAAQMAYPVFGIAGGLEHFRLTLDIQSREVILEAKPTLPSTTDTAP